MNRITIDNRFYVEWDAEFVTLCHRYADNAPLAVHTYTLAHDELAAVIEALQRIKREVGAE